MKNQNGVIELVGSDELNLGAASEILAHGDNTTVGSTGTVKVVSANGTQTTTTVVVGIQGTTDDEILQGLTEGEKVVTNTQTTTGTSGFPAGGGFGGGTGRGGFTGGGLGGAGGGRG